MTPVRLEPAAPQSQVKHSTTEPQRSLSGPSYGLGCMIKLEDLKVLRRSPDLLNNVKIGQGKLQLITKQSLFNHILGLQPFWSSDLNNPMNTPSNSPVISEEKMFR